MKTIMKKAIFGLLILAISFSATAQNLNLVGQFGQLIDTISIFQNYKTAIAGKQASLSGTGLARFSGSTVTYDNSSFLTANQSITVGVTGSDITSVATAGGTAPSVALTLATVNSSPGSFGGAASSLTAAVNAKGLITSLTANAIQIAESAVTSLTSDLAGKQTTVSITNTGSGNATFTPATGVLNIPSPVAASNIQRNDESTGLTSTSVTLLHTPLSATLTLSKNGIKLPAAKFSFTGTTVTLTTAAVAADTFSSDYNY